MFGDLQELLVAFAGARAGGETHYRVRVVSPRFVGLNRGARHRLVFDALKGEFAGGLHALNIETATPDTPA